MPRGDQDICENDKCPKCGVLYCSVVTVDEITFPVDPDTPVMCLGCNAAGPIKDWWDAFNKAEEGE